MKTSFRDNKSDELILLMNGWGMDERPFDPIKSSRDILFFSDYNSLDFEFDFSKYKKIILIAFSAGVFMSGFLKDKLPQFDLKIAINGVLNPFNPVFGMPEKSVSLIENVSLQNYLELRKLLIIDKNHVEIFNSNQPYRDIESSLQEFSALKKYSKTKVDFEFDKVLIGKNDLIIPFENQKRAWAGHKNTREINGGHFLFYNFADFDEIIKL